MLTPSTQFFIVVNMKKRYNQNFSPVKFSINKHKFTNQIERHRYTLQAEAAVGGYWPGDLFTINIVTNSPFIKQEIILNRVRRVAADPRWVLYLDGVGNIHIIPPRVFNIIKRVPYNDFHSLPLTAKCAKKLKNSNFYFEIYPKELYTEVIPSFNTHKTTFIKRYE